MINVKYKTFNTFYHINKILHKLNSIKLLAFDVETRSIYSQDEIAEAKNLLKNPELLSPKDLILSKQVAKSSGLSFPSLIKTTHFILGLSKNESVIIVAQDYKTEMLMWNWVVNYPGKLIVHNTGFDLKICYQRTKKFPIDYEDSQLLAKTLINDSETWKARVGLKILMGSYYDPKWSLFKDYDNKNLNDKKGLDYASIDGAATFYLWKLLQETCK